IARAEIDDIKRFGKLLKAHIPGTWPPPLNDKGSMEWFAYLVKKDPGAVGWGNWYFIFYDKIKKTDIAVGNGGFKGKPSNNGTVEIGYSVLEEYHGRGYAPEAVKAMCEWAFSHPEVNRIIAETYPDLTPSIRVLEKNDFSFTGKGSEDDIIRYELTRISHGNLL
ncbi:MAG: GNAT family N-acetyltransferase, partial [bacterium]|nr:GNAT family N-acetyltransferase [bacterium]